MADDPYDYFVSLLTVRSRRGDRVEALCPAHDDQHASLSVTRGDEQPVVATCHAGCSFEAVLTALNLSIGDVSDLRPRRVTSYYYTDPNGRVLYSVERWVPKTFRPRLPSGAYAHPVAADEVLFNLPAVLAAKARGEKVYLAEGEKDVETLRDFGYVGTTAMSGSSAHWLPQFSEALANADVVIIADNDVPGRKRARRVMEELAPYVRTVRGVTPRYGRDVSDLLLAGFGIHVVEPLATSDAAMSLHSYANVAPEPVSWIWEGWLPVGAFCLIEGDPGEGKSALTIELAARWTTGAAMPDGSLNLLGEPVNVGMTSAEDDPARVILPRFLVAGGDTHRLFNIAGVIQPGVVGPRLVDLSIDLVELRSAIETHALKVVVLDPLMAYLGSTRTHIDAEVRKVLSPLRTLAEETRCAVIAVRHLRKSGGKAVYAGGGSIGFTGAARSVIVVGRNPHDEAERVMAIAKNNLGPLATSQSFSIVSDLYNGIGAARLRWGGDSPLTAADLIGDGTPAPATEVRAEVTEEVVRLLTVQPLEYLTIRKRCLQSGIEHGEKMLRSVLKTVAVRYYEGLVGQPGCKTFYRLRSHGPIPPEDQDDQFGNDDDPEKHTEAAEPDSADESDSQNGEQGKSGAQFGIGAHRAPLPKWGDDPQPELHFGNGDEVPKQEQAEPAREWEIACSVCQRIGGLAFFDDLGQWRCFEHNPITGTD